MRVVVLGLVLLAGMGVIVGVNEVTKRVVVFDRPAPFRDALNQKWREVWAEHEEMLHEGVPLEERDAFLLRKGKEIRRWCHEQGQKYPGE